MKLPTWRLALAAVAVVVLASAAIGAVAAAAPQAGPDPADATTLELPVAEPDALAGGAAALRLRQLLGRRMVHAEVVIDRGDEGLVTVQADRGTIQAIGAGSLTIAQAGNRTATVATTEKTRVRKARAKATLADLAVGDQVLVLSRLDSGKAVAYLVVVPVVKTVRPAAAATPAP